MRIKHGYVYIFGLMLASFLTACINEKQVNQPIQVDFSHEGVLDLYKPEQTNKYTSFQIELAKTDYEIQRGLMDRYEIQDNQAMLFVFEDSSPRSFYMKNTYIPLDIIFIADNQTIVSYAENTTPLDETNIPSTYPAKYVLEIKGGLIKTLNIEVGDRMSYTEFESN